MILPKDPNILLSFLNTQLRDKYTSFDELCVDMQIAPLYRKDIESKLDAIGYAYSDAANSFVYTVK